MLLQNATYKQSLDFAKLHEGGPSNLEYHEATGLNIILWSEWGRPEYAEESERIYGTNDGFNNNRTHIETKYYFASAKTPVKAGPYYASYVQTDARYNIYDNTVGAYIPAPAKQSTNYGAIGFGLEYVAKGGKFADAAKIQLNYLEIPVQVVYHYFIGPGNMYGGIGPYFAYGIGGKSRNISSFGENNGGFKRFDAGAGFMLGYKLNNGASLDVGYDLGLVNVEYANQDVKGHTRNLSINLGYQIGRLLAKKK
jgi:hypothetical protein